MKFKIMKLQVLAVQALSMVYRTVLTEPYKVLN